MLLYLYYIKCFYYLLEKYIEISEDGYVGNFFIKMYVAFM